MKKQKPPTIEELIKERNELYVSRLNDKRLQYLISEINYFYFGIK